MTNEGIMTIIAVLVMILCVGVVGGLIIAVGRGFYNLMTQPAWIMTLVALIAILLNFVR